MSRPRNSARVWSLIQQSFQQFLTVPVLVIVAFLALAVGSYFLDHANLSPALNALRAWIVHAIPLSSGATSSLLATLASSLITVTSISFSFLILAVQGTAAQLTPAVLGQFLKRTLNQFIFGYFIGLAFYDLVILSTVGPSYTPIYGTAMALVLTLVALLLLPILFYAAIYQMNPTVVVEAIHDHVVDSREQQRKLLAATRRTPMLNAPVQAVVYARDYGFVTWIDLKRIRKATRARCAPTEVDFDATIGSFVTYNRAVAKIRTTDPEGLDEVVAVIQKAIKLDRERDYRGDPAYGIDQLRTIGWTTASTAKQLPNVALSVVYNLQDILARLAAERSELEDRDASIVLIDPVWPALLESLESLAIISVKGSQHQTFGAVVRTYADLYDSLPRERQTWIERSTRRLLEDLVNPILRTTDLDRALEALARAYASSGQTSLAAEIRAVLSRRWSVPTGSDSGR